MNQSVMKFDRPSLTNVWKADDDWTDLKKKEERKKRQNRLNQRAYRSRIAPKDPSTVKQRPFRVERFRIAEVPSETKQEGHSNIIELGTSKPANICESSTGNNGSSEPDTNTGKSIAIPDSVVRDHHVFREALALLALDLDNPDSSVLSRASSKYLQCLQRSDSIPNTRAEVQPAMTILDDALLKITSEDPFSILKSRTLGFDCDHTSTQSNTSVATSALQSLSRLDDLLINKTSFSISSDHRLLHLIHFNVFRALISNKLVLNDSTFLLRASNDVPLPGHQNLCEGLTLVRAKDDRPIPSTLYPTTHQMSIAHSSWLNTFPFPRVRDNLIRHQQEFDHRDLCNDLFGELFDRNADEFQQQPLPGLATDIWDTWEDDVTAKRNGLIVWGEPWDVEGWELTPGFLRKWSWIVEGCEDVIAASNRWRAKRGEAPLEVVSSSHPDGNFRDWYEVHS